MPFDPMNNPDHYKELSDALGDPGCTQRDNHGTLEYECASYLGKEYYRRRPRAAELVQISMSIDAPIWGYYNPTDYLAVQQSVFEISQQKEYPLDVLYVLTGTHGMCPRGEWSSVEPKYWQPVSFVGAVNRECRERKFLFEDLPLKQNTYENGMKVEVEEFNTGEFIHDSANMKIGDAMHRLNSKLREIVHRNKIRNSGKKFGYLLAYCCSAGTNPQDHSEALTEPPP